MNRRGLWMLSGIVLVMGVTACVNATQVKPKAATPDDPVIGLLSRGITQLDVNVRALAKRMNDAEQMPTGNDPALQELKALDLSGWQLHQQQWVLQRGHLVLARDLLQRAYGSQGDKEQLLDEWRMHRHAYTQALEELRQQRQSLENKHVEVEARLIERRLE